MFKSDQDSTRSTNRMPVSQVLRRQQGLIKNKIEVKRTLTMTMNLTNKEVKLLYNYITYGQVGETLQFTVNKPEWHNFVRKLGEEFNKIVAEDVRTETEVAENHKDE